MKEDLRSDGLRLSQRAGWAGGQPISYLMHLALTHPELISLAAGFVDRETLPVDAMRQATAAVLAEPDIAKAALQYGTTPGYLPLREQLLSRLLEADGQTDAETGLTPDRIVVTAGSNQLLHLVNEALLDPGDIVLCSAPSYFVYLGMVANQGARSVGVAIDQDGMIPEALEEELTRREQAGELERVKAIYITSYFDNPSTVTLAPSRRARIIEIAERWSKHGKIYVIEDAAYRELRYAGQDLASIRSYDPASERVIYAATFSKSFSPGLRVGWGLLPQELIRPIGELKGNIDFGSPNFAQYTMSAALRLGLFEPQVARLQASYREKMAAMLQAADEFLAAHQGVSWQRPEGGLYVWLRLPEEIDAGPGGRLLAASTEAGVLYVPGEYCYPTEGQKTCKNTIRLSFGVQNAANIRRGIAALSTAIGNVMAR